jgi:hypothetical protein
MASKHKSRDAGNLDMSKGTHKMVPLSEKVKVYLKYVCIGKNIICIGFSTIVGFRHSLGILEVIPSDKGRLIHLRKEHQSKELRKSLSFISIEFLRSQSKYLFDSPG